MTKALLEALLFLSYIRVAFSLVRQFDLGALVEVMGVAAHFFGFFDRLRGRRMPWFEFNLLLVANSGNFLEKVKIMNKSSSAAAPRTPMTSAAASRIQSATARKNAGSVPANSFASRAQSAAARTAGAKGD